MARRRWHHRLLAAASLAVLQSLPLDAVAQPGSTYGGAAPLPAGRAAPASMLVPAGGLVELKVRRMPDAVELVIEGVGNAPQLQQTTRGSSWEGLLLTTAPNGLRRGPQGFSLPELGFQSVRLDGSGTTYRLQVTPMPGYPVGRPVVSADGRDLILSFASLSQASLQTARPDLNQPGRVPQSAFVPPLQPRAVAPPLGDMAVGTMLLTNPSYVNISGPPVTMTLRNAPVKDVLLSLSQLGGYGFVYVEDCKNPGSTRPGGIDCDAKEVAGISANRKVTIAFRGENYGRAFNSALLSAGLQGRRDGDMIVVGPNVLDKGFGATMSKVYRLNQVSSSAAADYLANLGATITKTNTITTAVTEGTSATNAVAGAPNVATTNASTSTTVESYGSGVGPLRGLIGTTDTRLATITLVGPPQVVGIAEQYLKQLDLRQRQVALSVKILDVNLTNDTSLSNSFALKYGNNLIVNRGGRLENFINNFPSGLVPGQNFIDEFTAQIESSNAKVLASPTLILSENPEAVEGGADVSVSTSSNGVGGSNGSSGGSSTATPSTIGRTRANESFVTVGAQVVTNYTFQPSTPTQGAVCTAELSTAGLTFGARVNKIDDNGFVTFTLSPQISAVVDSANGPSQCGKIDILSVRRLDTGKVRVRDGQSLILTGVISDQDIQQVTKWPILGDIPLVGQFFRNTSNQRKKSELVIVVTPRIINDYEGGNFGYGYQPSNRDARRVLGGSSL